MVKRGVILGLMGALALAGCATTQRTTGADRGAVAVAGCYEAANGRIDARRGMLACDMALADHGLSPTLMAATLVNRGALRIRAQAFAAAIADFDSAIAAAPDTPDAYLNKGIALLQLGSHDAEAVAVLTAALDHNPTRPELVYYTRAGAYESLGRLRDAYDDYTEAAQLAPDWAEPMTQLQRFKFVRRKTMTG